MVPMSLVDSAQAAVRHLNTYWSCGTIASTTVRALGTRIYLHWDGVVNRFIATTHSSDEVLSDYPLASGYADEVLSDYPLASGYEKGGPTRASCRIYLQGANERRSTATERLRPLHSTQPLRGDLEHRTSSALTVANEALRTLRRSRRRY